MSKNSSFPDILLFYSKWDAFTSVAWVRVTRSCFLECNRRGHAEMGMGREIQKWGGGGGGGEGTEVGMERHAGGSEGATGRGQRLVD